MLTREALGWEHEPFDIPEEISSAWDHREAGLQQETEWQERFDAYKEAFPKWPLNSSVGLKPNCLKTGKKHAQAFIDETNQAAATKATRQASLAAIEAYAPILPELMGGSADLGGSNLTEWSGHVPMRAENPKSNYHQLWCS